MRRVAVLPALGATAEEEAFFALETAPFTDCADPRYSASLRTATVDKDALLLNCIVHAHRQYVAELVSGSVPTVPLAVGRQMVSYLKEDPALAPRLNSLLEAVMDKYGVTTEFINAILAAPAVALKKSSLPWVVGVSTLAMGLVSAIVTIKRRG